jgi:plastocyanin
VFRFLLPVCFAAFTAVPAHSADVAFKFVDAKNEPVVDAVVSLVRLDAPAKLQPLAAPLVLTQEKEEFVPFVLPVQVGSPIEFPNRDAIKHQVYSSSKAKKFELPLYAGAGREPVVFDQAGVVTLGCNIHDWMLGYVVVVETPWFSKSGDDGIATIMSVPPGRYRAEIWQRRLAALITREMTISDSAPPTTAITLELGRDRRIRRNLEIKSGGYK